jgi:hypothetical protein
VSQVLIGEGKSFAKLLSNSVLPTNSRKHKRNVLDCRFLFSVATSSPFDGKKYAAATVHTVASRDTCSPSRRKRQYFSLRQQLYHSFELTTELNLYWVCQNYFPGFDLWNQ